MKKKCLLFCTMVLAMLMSSGVAAQSNRLFTVKVNDVKAPIQPTMWGIFFEDINLGADGGIYAELIKNRSFEFDAPLMGWREQRRDQGSGSVLVLNRGDSAASSPRFVRLGVTSDQGSFGLGNEGFRGMGIESGKQYNFSVLARQHPGSNVALTAELINANGEKMGSATVTPGGQQWREYTASITATSSDPKARFVLWAQGKGAVDLDMISLFPQHTWKNRPKGMRADLVQLLAEMKPGFLRFPGGCIVEGRELDTRYQWKNTIGSLDQRKSIINRWNTEFRHRPTPDYYQTFGLGFFEYFQLAEDIGAEPLPILNCGMACQFNSSEVVPVEQLDPFLQDALDLIEFANGSAQTKWGAVRSAMGHPGPFNLKLLGIGNEQWGEQYIERYKVFAKAIKDKYPNIQLISSVGPDPDGPRFNYLNQELRSLNADILDEHYYRAPDWFLQNARRYDNYDRRGPKIFAGEYAAQSVGVASPNNKNNWRCALSEAAFMTGLERNADVVTMASYAPLFAHVDGWQWTPDLIWFDNVRSYGTPNYYVQKLFSSNRGTHVVPLMHNNETVAGQNGIFATAAVDRGTNEVIIKVVNSSEQAQPSDFLLDGVKKTAAKATHTLLRGDRPEEENSLTDPGAVKPVDQQIPVKNRKVSIALPAQSVSVIRVKLS